MIVLGQREDNKIEYEMIEFVYCTLENSKVTGRKIDQQEKMG